MTFRNLLIEAIARAGSMHGHHEALCLIDPNTLARVSYMLDECRKLIERLDNGAQT